MSIVIVQETNTTNISTLTTTAVVVVSNSIPILANLTGLSLTAGSKLVLDGAGGDTYLLYNSSSGALEMWVDGTKVNEWSS